MKFHHSKKNGRIFLVGIQFVRWHRHGSKMADRFMVDSSGSTEMVPTRNAYMMLGAGGQSTTLIPFHDLVIVHLVI